MTVVFHLSLLIFIRITVSMCRMTDMELPVVYQPTKYTVANLSWWGKRMPTTENSDGASLLIMPKKTQPHTKISTVYPNKLLEDREEDAINTNDAALLRPSPFTDSISLEIETRQGNAKPPLVREEGSFCRRSFDGRSGYCILAYQCLHVVKEFRLHGSTIDICTYSKNIPVICCPLADKNVDGERISAQKCREYHDALKDFKISMERNFSGKLCVASVPMIVGGKSTNSESYPHMAALGWSENGTDIKWGCGGSLISELYVLTAAHCVTSVGTPPDIVRLGAQRLNDTSRVVDIKILVIILHPKYVSSSYYHDIALLKLSRRVIFSNFIRPACLWQLPHLRISSATAAGWGRIEFMGPKSDELQKVDLNLIDQKLCKKFYRKERRLSRGIIEEQFCAGHIEGGRDTCQGDSGGPLHAELPEYKCVKFIIGVTSFGKFCAAPNAPGVYTKVHCYLDWIEKIVFKL